MPVLWRCPKGGEKDDEKPIGSDGVALREAAEQRSVAQGEAVVRQCLDGRTSLCRPPSRLRWTDKLRLCRWCCNGTASGGKRNKRAVCTGRRASCRSAQE